jgi:thioester reductase-like protein
MVSAARWRGVKAYVYRLPFIATSSATSYFRHDGGDFLQNLISGSLEMGAFPSLGADLSAVLPVGYLSKTIVAVMVEDLSAPTGTLASSMRPGGPLISSST